MREESGWTLIEVLIVAVLLTIVLGGTLNLLDTTAKVAPAEQERAEAVREAQVGLARMTRELRQATKVLPLAPAPGATGSVVQVETPVKGVTQTVKYDCSQPSRSLPSTAKACVRTQLGSTRVEYTIDRVLNTTVFTRTGNNYFAVRIEVPASGERKKGLRHRIVLDDGFYMRNITN